MSILVDPSLFFDPYKACTIIDSYLPLLDQQGKLQFITFRCIDSIPFKQREELTVIKKNFEKSHPKPWATETLVKYRKLIGFREETLLDAGFGKCLLRNYSFRQIVEDALLYFNDKRYDIHAYVIMPNHVHILMCMLNGYKIESTLESIKRFSGRKINFLSGCVGKYWDGQNYCRMIRNQNHYDTIISYIKNNPKFLRKGEFTLRILK